jgi:uncharacterized protein
MFARHFIDSLDFARKGLELRGELGMAEMPRLQDMLAAPEGKVGYVLRGVQGKNGESLLELALEGNCQLRCQRCLQAMPYAIDTVSFLMPVPESELEGSLAEAGEPEEDEVDRITADVHLDVLALIEDEILLGLPLSPRHEFGVCEAAVDNAPAGEQHPFAVLRGLKKR